MRIIALCLVLVFAGCVSSRIDNKNLTSPELNPDEMHFAEAMAHYGQGLILSDYRRNDFSNAMEHFVIAADLDTDSYILQSRAAIESLVAGDKDAAVSRMKSFCTKYPDSYAGWLDYARVCEAAGEYDTALTAYKHSIKLNPTNAVIYAAMAGLEFQSGNDEKALSYIKQGISHNPDKKKDFLGFCHNQGRKYILSNELKRAIPCFKFIMDNDGGSLGQYEYLLGDIYRRIHETSKAEYYYNLATKKKDPLPDAFIKLAVLQQNKDVQKSIKTLNRGQEIFPDNILIALTLAYTYRDAGMIDKYIAQYTKITRLAADVRTESLTPEFYISYASQCEKVGRVEVAERILQDCLKSYPDSPVALNFLAYMWAEQNRNLSLALDYVTRAIEAEPDNGAYIDTRGWIYYKLGKYNKALKDVVKADKIINNDPVINEHLGDIYMALGQSSQAVNYWTEALRQNHDNCELRLKLQERNINVPELLKSIKKKKKNNDECKK